MNPAAILFAIKTLVRQSETQEIHGTPWEIAKKLLIELTGSETCYREFRAEHLCHWQIEEIVAGSNIVFMRTQCRGIYHLIDAASMVPPEDDDDAR